MNNSWHCALHVTRDQARLLLTATEGDALKARSSTTPEHPRALLTLLEGLSLWPNRTFCPQPQSFPLASCAAISLGSCGTAHLLLLTSPL